MRRREVIIAGLLLSFWLVLAESFDLQHILAGLVLAVGTVWLWRDLFPYLPRVAVKEMVLLGRLVVRLIGFVIASNIAVAKTVLFNGPSVTPTIIIMRPPLETNWARVLLANCVTITPGTVTIDVHPETGEFMVHALTTETAADLLDWQLIEEIAELELWRKERMTRGLVDGRADDTNPFGSVASHSGADGH